MATLTTRINKLVSRPGFTIPGTPGEIATMRACAVLVLDNDALLASAALHHAQQVILAPGISKATGTTLEEKLKDKSIRQLLEAYSLLTSGLRRRDHDLSRKEQ